MLRERLPARLARARSLRAVYEALLGYPMIGPFMAYQLATDLNYSELLDFSEDDLRCRVRVPMRGLRKVFSDLGSRPAQLIMRMVDRQEDEFDRLGLDFRGPVRPPAARDRLPGALLRGRQVRTRRLSRAEERARAHQDPLSPRRAPAGADLSAQMEPRRARVCTTLQRARRD